MNVTAAGSPPLRGASADAIALLLARHGPELARHLRRIVRDDHAAEDLLQDTFLRAHAALDRLAPDANVRAWLYRIATNAALNFVRRQAREDVALVRHAHERVGAHSAQHRDDERATALWASVAALPERQRLAITLRVADELNYAEIARRMGGTEAAARANVHQATKRLRRELR
jgi:RNA polymerase sigma-70 factor (ECF subfamily)